ncbi:adenosylmethionine--8-amino-7-oxononanoate transaminase [Candidatus Haliotispira prima]|uniref:Adenosylmethionine-8-amino-7-oxononanoate aminotransferase n=1 Tax=Candidatus Haliotispira prima TaxID=3034016 RepID=A0ABY8MK85_9SPIO|nr:adenosylmethionine--8-amino-7-oxononanoate transaminase [Candidatus Haliotispira prima]
MKTSSIEKSVPEVRMGDAELRRTDRAHVWHPYSNIDRILEDDFPLIERAEGCYIYDSNGKSYLDGIASWWCVNFGHSHPELLRAIEEQSRSLQNVILAGMSHRNVISLSQKLSALSPIPDSHCYFTGDGASAVEAALRIALHYWENRGYTQRKKFFCLKDAYHGDTLGAISVGYVERFHHQLSGLLQDNYRAMSPHCAACPFGLEPDFCDTECFAGMEGLFAQHAAECAAVIVEPLCQGAGGIRLYPEDYLLKLRVLCDRYNVLLICDEIAVGFGRSGSMFASERAGVRPDLMTVGKGLTGGYLPMSAVLASDEIYQSFRPSRGGETFFHGHTYSGNPIVSALALRALDLYSEERVLERIQPLIPLLAEECRALQKEFLPRSYSSAKGMIGAIEICAAEGGAKRAAGLAEAAWQRGLYLRPLGSVLYLWPPLLISEVELRFCFQVLRDCLQNS